MANSVDPDQTASIGAVCSGSTLFASIFNSSVILGNCLQQMNFFSWRFKGKLAADDHFKFCGSFKNNKKA